MTVPAETPRNYCPSCDDFCHDHSRICTVCGTTLQYPRQPGPTTTTSSSSSSRFFGANVGDAPAFREDVRNTTSTTGTAAARPQRTTTATAGAGTTGRSGTSDPVQRSRQLRTLLATISQQIDAVDRQQQILLRELQQAADEWSQAADAFRNSNANNNNNNTATGGGSIWETTRILFNEAMDPSNTVSYKKRPTSQTTLDALPRITLQDRSSLFYRARIVFHHNHHSNETNKNLSNNNNNNNNPIDAIPAEFGGGPSLTTIIKKNNNNTASVDDDDDDAAADVDINKVDAASTSWKLGNASLLVPLEAATRTGKKPFVSSSSSSQLAPASSTITKPTLLQEIVAEQQQQSCLSASVVTADSSSSSSPLILFMERGDNITFCQKAWMAQDAGAAALVIGNHVSTPWPYTMRDSKGEAVRTNNKQPDDDVKQVEEEHLTIPIVMVKQSDSKMIVQAAAAAAADSSSSSSSPISILSCSLELERQSADECVVCQEAFSVNDVVLRLPDCSHIFHEKCALAWLQQHNTCPYCRHELPTDDAEYEQERRRQQGQREQGVSDGASSAIDFYG